MVFIGVNGCAECLNATGPHERPCCGCFNAVEFLRSIEFWQIELRRYTHADVDDPLLCNRQDVVGNPIQHQA